MKKIAKLFVLFSMPFFLSSCTGQNPTISPEEIVKPETRDTVASPRFNDRNIYSKYEYTDSVGKRLIIENGYPRGGTKYTDPNGEVYVWAVFWTRIINETDNPLELKIDFPVDSYEVPSLPGKYFKILVPPDTMTLEKFYLFNYGLTDLEFFLDRNIHNPSSVKRTIDPKKSSGFYVVMLCLVDGAHGTMRTGLSLKGQDLFYRIKIDGSKSNSKSSDKEIQCGRINLNLK
ncbi:hypothetical protein Q4E93_02390 [Flavitalea sp. BT771]|uniref:hypothetical protein n=1 Tax=Flavitalea sp. BT771 TaxID=3063329 RepID=UPI0026E20926|nr:hypothetical protein [Flavitalea sp. BT771]MDO6429420.1 hypothetical protein [Flavitalea sp. BT771]MDV6218452.1 hypothetical protein [Flavitalea sp. BT771]